jgi:hypothetical protein
MDYNTIRSAVRGALSERERAPTPRGRIIDPDEARRDADRRRNCERARGQLRAAEERHRLIERELIPACTNQNPCAHSRRPMVMILDGRSMRRFHASQARVTMSS